VRAHAKASSANSYRRVGLTLATALVACATLFAVLAAGASAKLTRTPLSAPSSPITGAGSGPLTITTPGGIALDQATGNLFLNHGSGAAGSSTFLLNGTNNEAAPVGLVAPYTLTGFNFTGVTNGVAFDPASGTLYVVTSGGSSTALKIKRFARNPATEKFESVLPDLTATRGSAPGSTGFAAGSANAAATVDEDGNLFVGEFSCRCIVKFNSAGTQVATFNWFTNPSFGAVRPNAGIAVDSHGNVFVARGGSNGIITFPGTGSNEVENPAVTVVPGTVGATSVTIDAATDTLFVPFGNRVVQYDAANPTALVEEMEFGKSTLGTTTAVAYNSATDRVYVGDDGKNNVTVFGFPVPLPTPLAFAASDVTGSKATLNGSVDLEGFAEEECIFEYGKTTSYGNSVPCAEVLPTDSLSHPVSGQISGLEPDGVVYHYRLVAANANGSEASADRTFVTALTVATEDATNVGTANATLNGTVRPEGSTLSTCKFEWGLTTSAGYEKTTNCNPAAGSIDPDFTAHAVSASLSGLKANATYKFRLSTTKESGTVSGEELTFTTTGAPQLANVRSQATQSTALLMADINPSGFSTSYRFEWGPTAAYGNSAPLELEPNIDKGTEAVRVAVKVSGLAPASTYHYRLVATSVIGTTKSSDRTLETLNSCGLPEDRCFELVSPRDRGLVSMPGEQSSFIEIPRLAGESPGSFAFGVEGGYPGATTGGETLYRSFRDEAGWSSTQYNHSLEASSEGSNARFAVIGLSPDLECSVVASRLPLTSDPIALQIIEAGGGNLYSRAADGTYTLITDRAPETMSGHGTYPDEEFELIGMSNDCRRVVFVTEQHYVGISGAGTRRTYEWDDGTLRYVGMVPDGSSESAVAASPGNGLAIVTEANRYNAVSEDGSRTFFTATRLVGNNPSEAGKTGVFARIDGTTTLDVSLSQTTTPSEDATYQGATPDGSRVYFTANAGLTPETSSTGRDLYECEIVEGLGGEPECELTDLSVDADTGGADAGATTNGGKIGALIGMAEDGSRAYFIARGQLVAGEGNSFAENSSANTLSVYEYKASSGAVRFVGTVDDGVPEVSRITLAPQANTTSRVSPDGRYLLFESSIGLVGNETGGKREAYLYDAEAKEEALVCVSCRPDGKPRFDAKEVLARSGKRILYRPRSLVVRDGGPLVFFRSQDGLTEGSIEGEAALYEWAHGQVFKLADDLPGATPSPGKDTPGTLAFAGASLDGTDVYFFDSAALNWENPEARASAWTVRVGGGFEEPTSPVSCDPNSEGSCQGAVAPPPAAPQAGSASFSGTGNVKAEPKQKKAKKKKSKARKNKKKQGKKNRNGKRARHANTDRGAGK